MTSENNPSTAEPGLVENLKSNPKAMAAAAVIIGLGGFLLLKGSSDEGEKPAKVAAVSIGQTVTVQNPNIGNTILLAAPGAVGLADSDNDKDDMIVCRHVLSGTKAVVNEESVVNYIPFVKITLSDGECAGKIGWMAKVNLAQQ